MLEHFFGGQQVRFGNRHLLLERFYLRPILAFQIGSNGNFGFGDVRLASLQRGDSVVLVRFGKADRFFDPSRLCRCCKDADSARQLPPESVLPVYSGPSDGATFLLFTTGFNG